MRATDARASPRAPPPSARGVGPRHLRMRHGEQRCEGLRTARGPGCPTPLARPTALHGAERAAADARGAGGLLPCWSTCARVTGYGARLTKSSGLGASPATPSAADESALSRGAGHGRSAGGIDARRPWRPCAQLPARPTFAPSAPLPLSGRGASALACSGTVQSASRPSGMCAQHPWTSGCPCGAPAGGSSTAADRRTQSGAHEHDEPSVKKSDATRRRPGVWRRGGCSGRAPTGDEPSLPSASLLSAAALSAATSMPSPSAPARAITRSPPPSAAEGLTKLPACAALAAGSHSPGSGGAPKPCSSASTRRHGAAIGSCRGSTSPPSCARALEGWVWRTV